MTAENIMSSYAAYGSTMFAFLLTFSMISIVAPTYISYDRNKENILKNKNA
jgi:hypothetical protein